MPLTAPHEAMIVASATATAGLAAQALAEIL